MSNNETTKLEFLLTLNDNIICQRFFNVRGFNPKVKRSIDLHYDVKNICEEIEERMTMYLSQEHSPHIFITPR